MTAYLSVALLALNLAAGQSTPHTTIVLARHAEAVPNAGNDPVLSEAGIARANALAAVLRDAGVTAVFTTQYQRTALTGEPVAAASKLAVVKMPVQGATDAYVAQVLKEIFAKHAGGTVVIVGHSNTVPAFVKALTGATVEIAHDSYDQLFVVTASAPGSGKLVRARYGS